MPGHRPNPYVDYTPSNRVKAYAAAYLEHDDYPDASPDLTCLARHVDDLPDGWLDPPSGPLSAGHPYRRATYKVEQALFEFEQALNLAGFTPSETDFITGRGSIGLNLNTTLARMWDYRRFGFPVVAALNWHAAQVPPPVARVYADAGYKAHDARRLEKWLDKAAGRTANRHLVPNWRTRVTLLILDHQISRERAVEYVMAGVAHDEVRDWEKRRRNGEDIRSALIALRGLTGR